VLRERLQRHLEQCNLEPVRFPYLVPAPQTRFAVLGRETYEERLEGQDGPARQIVSRLRQTC